MVGCSSIAKSMDRAGVTGGAAAEAESASVCPNAVEGALATSADATPQVVMARIASARMRAVRVVCDRMRKRWCSRTAIDRASRCARSIADRRLA